VTTLIIGSTAAKHWLPDFREPKDLDLFTTQASTDFGPNVEPFSHVLISEWLEKAFANGRPWQNRGMADLDELYTIKISHSYWELHGTWTKHMEDAARFKREGAQLLPDLHDLLYKVWVEQHGAKKVNLNMDSSDFFNDAVKRVYDHDSIHASVAYFDHPLYEDVMMDGQSVKTDMRKVWALPFDLRVKLFREEVYATALERIVIPRDYKCSPTAAYVWALRRTITSLTKGRSATFMADNYELFRNPDCDYVQRHLDNRDRLVKL
jgi:hypothetical protein